MRASGRRRETRSTARIFLIREFLVSRFLFLENKSLFGMRNKLFRETGFQRRQNNFVFADGKRQRHRKRISPRIRRPRLSGCQAALPEAGLLWIYSEEVSRGIARGDLS